MSHRIRAMLSALLAVSLAGGLLVATASPAPAESFLTQLRATWAYTDARTPLRSFVDTADTAPVGVWRDDDRRYHLSKSYFTFDLSPLKGARIFAASAFAAETHANDCTVDRATELWLTDTVTRPTWARPPRERTLLDGVTTAPCLTSTVVWDAAEGIRQALAAGQSQVTLALRISADHQGDPAYGRRYANDLRILVRYNLPPDTPTDLSTDSRPCNDGTFLTNNRASVLAARLTDPDHNNLSATFAIWPVDQADQRTELTTPFIGNDSIATVVTPPSAIEHARTYAWSVRADDGDDVSAWTEPCQFSTDLIGPDVEPTVSSTVYPEDCPNMCGGVGVPGEFTFTANGVADVVGFYYGRNETPFTFVPADRPGGVATITFTPQVTGPHDLYVQSVDPAGTRSPLRRYGFFVRGDWPVIACTPPNGGVGVAHECAFSPAPYVTDVVQYTYQLGDGPEINVPAGPDHRAAATITPTQPAGNQLLVRSTTSTGTVSSFASYYFHTSPAVSSEVYPEERNGGGPEITGTLLFTPRMPNVVEYVYAFAGEPETTVPAGSDGTASIEWAPTQPGEMYLYVHSRSADGTGSETGTYVFYVNP